MRLLVAATCLLAAANAQAAEQLAALERPSPVAAYAGSAVWSSFDAASGHYQLVAYHDGKINPLPVPSRTVPFDADLGTAADGSPLAVYSRCRREPSLTAFPAGVDWRSARRCDLYAVSLSGGQERRLRVSSPRASEFVPAVWQGRVAFAARSDRDASSARIALRLGRTSGPATALPALRQGLSGSPGPTRLDLYGKTVAVTWDRILHRSGGAITGYASELYLATASRVRRLDRVDWGDLESNELFAPVLARGAVRYGYANVLKRRSVEFRRVQLRSGRITRQPAPADVYSAALTDPLAIFSTAGGAASTPCASGCTVFRNG